jgi:hypothetical protein
MGFQGKESRGFIICPDGTTIAGVSLADPLNGETTFRIFDWLSLGNLIHLE